MNNFDETAAFHALTELDPDFRLLPRKQQISRMYALLDAWWCRPDEETDAVFWTFAQRWERENAAAGPQPAGEGDAYGRVAYGAWWATAKGVPHPADVTYEEDREAWIAAADAVLKKYITTGMKP